MCLGDASIQMRGLGVRNSLYNNHHINLSDFFCLGAFFENIICIGLATKVNRMLNKKKHMFGSEG